MKVIHLLSFLICIYPSVSFLIRHRSHKSLHKAIVNVNIDDSKQAKYDIVIENDCLRKLPSYIKSKKVLVVTNDIVGPLYLDKVKNILLEHNIDSSHLVLPDGEENKSMKYLNAILDSAMENKLDRKSCFIALGGGVIGDMCGFAASIYQRGVPFIQVPTTLMAMVDSAVGGKTAVNHEKGKNMIGSFYQPQAVIADLETLNTLLDREYRSGISEIVKYGLIQDQKFFHWLDENIEGLLERKDNILTEAIRRSCENKATVVAADEKESGIRATLNLGHTFGHAIEAGFGYGIWLHGEAVAAGTIMAAELSYELGLISVEYYNKIKSIFERLQLPINLTNNEAIKDIGHEEYMRVKKHLNTQVFLDYMSIDKKVADGKLNLVLLQGDVGNAIITSDYDQNKLISIVDKYCQEKLSM